MDRKRISALTEQLNTRSKENQQLEYWLARELQHCLGYRTWENFEAVILRAMVSAETAGAAVEDHFREVTKLIMIGKGGQRPVPDYMLTRYACYLIAQNGDPRKEEIAFAQSYFAVSARTLEVVEERIAYMERLEARDRLRASEKRLSQNIYERDVDEKGFGRIRSQGDQALFGGRTTQQMKDQYGIKSGPLADHLPTLTIAAKNLATEMTNYNVEEKDLRGEGSITREHVQNNSSVRAMLGERGIHPEDLPPAESIKKLERRVKKQEQAILEQAGRLPEDGTPDGKETE